MLLKNKPGWVGKEGGRTRAVERRMFCFLLFAVIQKSHIPFAYGLQTEGRVL